MHEIRTWLLEIVKELSHYKTISNESIHQLKINKTKGSKTLITSIKLRLERLSK